MPLRERLAQKQIHYDARRLRTILSGAGGAAAPHTLLGVVHSDTAVSAPVEGALVLADATPEWNILLHPSAEGYAMVTDATTWLIDQTPVWTGDHTWDDGDGDSPATHWIPENNDDWLMWAENNATPGNSDFIVKFPAADEDAEFIWRDSGDADIAYINGAGEMWISTRAAINAAPLSNVMLYVADTALDFAGIDFRGLRINLVKTAGASGVGDEFHGILERIAMNQVGGTVGHMYGSEFQIEQNDGAVGSGGSNRNLYGGLYLMDLNAGDVYGDVWAGRFRVDQEAAHTVEDDIEVLSVSADVDGTVGGTVYMIRIAESSGIDFGIYQDGTAQNILKGYLSVGTTGTDAALDVDQNSSSAAKPVARFDQGDASEQHIVLSMNGADQDFPAILQLDVTGAPTLWWDESESRLIWDENFGLSAGDLYLPTTKGIIHADGVAAGWVLLADGTRYVPADAAANLPIAPGNRGDIIRAEAGPVWAAYGAATLGAVLIGDGIDVISDTTPTLVGNLSMDDGVGDSPHIFFYGGSNDDHGEIYLINDAIANHSDLCLQLPGQDADAQLRIRDGAGVTRAWIDADGDADFANLTLDEYITHDGDANTYIHFQADNITLHVGGVDMIDIVEGGSDYVSIGSTTIDSHFTAKLYVMDGNIGTSVSGSFAVVQAFAYGADSDDHIPIWRGRRARGTRGAPTAAQSGDVLGRIGSGGYGATGFAAESTGYMQMLAAENFTDADMGTHLQLATTPTGSIAPVERVRLTASGRVKVGGTAGANAQLDVDQHEGLAAIAVLRLDQADVDQPFIRFVGTAANGDLTRSIVDEGDQASETRHGWVKINIQDTGNQVPDGNYLVPFYSLSA